MQSAKGRSQGLVNASGATDPYHSFSSQSESINLDDARNLGSRDPAYSRGRPPGPSNVSTFAVSPSTGQTISPRSLSSAATTRSPLGLNGPLERRPSVTQGHHYPQKSHGVHQHVRNASFVNSPATSPLSPQVASTDYATMNMIYHGTPDIRSKELQMTAVNGSSPLTASSAGDRDVSEGDPTTLGHKRVDRAHSSKTRRGQTQHSSHARQQQEQKTVGEYALHHLFTAVSL